MKVAPTRTLALVNVLALMGLAALWVDQQGQWRNINWVAPAPVKPVLATPSITQKSATDLASFSATLDRPLFAPDRRPPPPVLPPPPPPPPDPLADAHLFGLITGKAGAVLIRSEGKVRSVKLTEKVGEWTLQTIDDRSVTFAKANETRVVRLEYARLNVPEPAAAPAPVANKASAAVGGPTAVSAAAADAAWQREEAAKERIREQIRARTTQNKP